jgi:hypothetical protein
VSEKRIALYLGCTAETGWMKEQPSISMVNIFLALHPAHLGYKARGDYCNVVLLFDGNPEKQEKISLKIPRKD